MANAKEIARIFDYLAHDTEGKPIENTRLNKMLFFAQGHALVELGHALFDNQIDAWKHGPVVAVVYNGLNKIHEATEKCGLDGIQIDPDDMELILDVWNQYSKHKASELVDMTHQPGTPWFDVYREGIKNIHLLQCVIQDIKSTIYVINLVVNTNDNIIKC